MASLTDPEIIEYGNLCYESARRGRRVWLERCHRNWALVNNEMDVSDREGWQEQVPIPKVGIAVEFLANSLISALLSSSQFYTLKVRPRNMEWLGTALSVWLDRHLTEAGFADAVYESIKGGIFLSKVALSVSWQEANRDLSVADALIMGMVPPEATDSKLVLESVDPVQLYWDPSGRSKWVMREVMTDWDDLYEEARNPDSGYRADEVRKCRDENQEPAEWREERDVRADTDDSGDVDWRKTVTLLEFYGKVVNRDGERVMERATFTIANSKYLVRPLREFPYAPDYGSPLVLGNITTQPFKDDARSIIDNVSAIAEAITDFACAMLEAGKFECVRAFEVDTGVMLNPAELSEGMKPALLLKREPDADPNRPVIRPVETGEVPRDALPLLQYLTYLFEEGTQSTEIARGMPARTQKDATATEFSGKLARASAGLQFLARNLERNWIEPLLKQILDLIVLHQPAHMRDEEEILERLGGKDDPEAMERTAMLMSMGNEQLAEMVRRQIVVEARGMSATLEQREQLDRLQIGLGIVNSLPQLAQRLKPEPLLHVVWRALGLDPSRFTMSEAEVAQQQQSMMLQQQLGAGANGGPPQSPQQGYPMPQPLQALPALGQNLAGMQRMQAM